MPGEDPRAAGRAVSGGFMDSGNRAAGVPATCDVGFPRMLAAPVGAILGVLSATTTTAVAQTASGLPIAGMSLGTFEVMQFAVFAGVLGAAMMSAIWLIRERTRVSS